MSRAGFWQKDHSQVIAAVLLDWDGTLVASEPVHAQAWRQILAEAWHPQDEREWYGIPDSIMFENLKAGLPEELRTLEAALDAKRTAYGHLLGGKAPCLVAGAELVVRALSNIPTAIVTASPRSEIQASCHSLGWEGLFQCIVSAEDVTHPKPNPQPYLLASKNLGVCPAQCLAIDDSPAGFESAQRANTHALHYCPPGMRQIEGVPRIQQLPQMLTEIWS